MMLVEVRTKTHARIGFDGPKSSKIMRKEIQDQIDLHGRAK